MVNKRYTGFKVFFLTFFLFLLIPLSAYADHSKNITVSIDTTSVNYDSDSGFPHLDSVGRTQVPLRKTMESYGAKVSWNQAKNTATIVKNSTVVTVPIGTAYIFKNGNKIETDTVAIIRENRVYLPIRPVLEAFGASVSWNGEFGLIAVSSPHEEKKIAVHFIDVGEGDCSFIDFGDYEILIDAGDSSCGEKVANYIKPMVDWDLDLIIATHVHWDHIGGMSNVIKSFQVDKIIESGDTYSSASYKSFIKAAKSEPNCIIMQDSNMTIDLGEGADLEIIDFLDGDANLNNNSVICRLSYKNTRILFMGDAERSAELLGLPFFSPVDVVKVGHHGSYTSSCLDFISAIKPKFAIISAAKNGLLGHPHFTTLQNYKKAGASVYATFKSGDIVLTSNGNTICFNSPEPLL